MVAPFRFHAATMNSLIKLLTKRVIGARKKKKLWRSSSGVLTFPKVDMNGFAIPRMSVINKSRLIVTW